MSLPSLYPQIWLSSRPPSTLRLDIVYGSSCLFPSLQPERSALAITEIALGKIEVNGDRGFQRDMPVHLIKNWMEVDSNKVIYNQAWKMCLRLREYSKTCTEPNVHTCCSDVDRVAGAVFISFGDLMGRILPPTTNSLLIPISVSLTGRRFVEELK